MHLSFLRGLDGDYRTKTISFSDRVEALLGPIASWEQEVNVQYADTLSKNQTHLIADRVDLFDSSDLSWNRNNPQRKQSSSWEVKALQRVTVRSQTDKGLFAASGDELKYDSGSDVLRISGAPQNASILLPNANNPNSPSELKVGTFAIQLKTGNFESTLEALKVRYPTTCSVLAPFPLGTPNTPPTSGPVLPSQETSPIANSKVDPQLAQHYVPPTFYRRLLSSLYFLAPIFLPQSFTTARVAFPSLAEGRGTASPLLVLLKQYRDLQLADRSKDRTQK